MALTVETGYLRGFADQIDGTRTGALSVLKAYCTTHCGNTEGLHGFLDLAQVQVESNTKAFLKLMDGADRGLWLTAYDLRQTADDYDRADVAAADRLWTSGRTWERPKGYQEHDVVTKAGFSKGATVNLAVPSERHDSKYAKESVFEALGLVNDIVAKFTGIDLLGEAMPIVFGEWGVLRRIAEAHDEMERGFDLIAQDLTEGMDCLSSHWTSDGGGASSAFDYHIRERWIKGFRMLANFSNSAQQTYEWIANAYEDIVNSFLLALNFYAVRIRKAFVALGTATGPKLLWNLYQLVSSTLQLIEDTLRLLYMQTKMFCSAFEMWVANIHFFYNVLCGDQDVFKEA